MSQGATEVHGEVLIGNIEKRVLGGMASLCKG